MFSRASLITPKRQQGLAFLVLVIVIVLAFTTYIVSELSVSQVKVDRDKNTQLNLKKAKQSVIDYAVTYADRDIDNNYGILPNPETFFNGNDGNMAGAVGAKNTNVIGWLPWRSLDLPNLKDDSGTCLFYAVSGTYKLGALADMVNEDSIGMFRILNSADTIVQGGSADSQVVALVIAPGASLQGQVRNPTVVSSSCGRDYGNLSAYLEGNGVYDNSTTSAAIDTIDDFIHATENSSTEATPYNDKFLTITREEIWNAIVNRDDFKQKMENLTQGLAMCLAEYANMNSNTGRRLPWPVISDLGVTINYRDNDQYVDDDGASNGYSGRFPFNVASSNDAIWLATIPAGVEGDLFITIAPDIMPIDPDPPIPPQPQLCGNLVLTSGPDAGTVIDLYSAASTYRKLWDNWKDHFFYIISKSYEPDNSGDEKVCADAGTFCVTVNATEYAGVVIFSGSRLTGATRNDKSLLTDYLEDGKSTKFDDEKTDKTGDKTYVYTDPDLNPAIVNDIMFCIQDQPTGTPLDVIECL